MQRRNLICYYSNGDLCGCEDNVLLSGMKLSCFHTTAHLVFHWCLYNKEIIGWVLRLNVGVWDVFLS